MDLLPTPEQEEIARSTASFLAKELPLTRLRDLLDGPSAIDRVVWSRAAALGWFGLGLAEDLGGVGYGLAEEVLVFREIGRVLAPGPLVATVLAARLAGRCGQVDLAASIVAGDTVVGLGMPRPGAPAEISDRVSAELDLFDGEWADLVLVAVPTGAALIAASELADVTTVACMDEATRLARARVDEVTAAAYSPTEAEDLYRRGAILTSAMLVGIAEATRDQATEFAKNRVQFGKPIGSYQAIKHPCADMAIRSDAAVSQLFFAALAVDTDRPDAGFQASAAKIVATDAARRNAAANVQIHGGMGFTFEQDAHLYVKRAHVLEQAFGPTAYHLALALESGPES
jgi:alkylation response protein AidB-like acyl-CoA dehydrogenase